MSDATTIHFGITLDCADPVRLAEFWCAALGYTVAGGAGAYVALVPGSGTGPKLLLQRVPEAKATKNRMHLDIDTPDLAGTAARLLELGATQLASEPCHEHGHTWVLMADPDGNEFCLVADGSGGIDPS